MNFKVITTDCGCCRRKGGGTDFVGMGMRCRKWKSSPMWIYRMTAETVPILGRLLPMPVRESGELL